MNSVTRSIVRGALLGGLVLTVASWQPQTAVAQSGQGQGMMQGQGQGMGQGYGMQGKAGQGPGAGMQGRRGTGPCASGAGRGSADCPMRDGDDDDYAGGYGMGYGYGPMGPGMMGQGGYGYGPMGPGMMGYGGRGMMGYGGQGMMGYGGQGMRGYGMRGAGGYGMSRGGYGMGGQGMRGYGPGMMQARDLDLNERQAKAIVDARLAFQGNARIEAGTVKADGDGAYVVDVVTVKEKALVDQVSVDRKTGMVTSVR